ncbi:MAG: hypothetical protein KDJ15_00175 [Alphaproteobacteria bacterium]|nr:hypothetical protein [Alphaproteobacteria bacterium]
MTQKHEEKHPRPETPEAMRATKRAAALRANLQRRKTAGRKTKKHGETTCR